MTGGNALVLLSGGIDSTACVAFYLSKRFDVEAFFVDFGQPAAPREQQAASAISRHYDIPLHTGAVHGVASRQSGYVPGRNALLLTVALAVRAPTRGLLALGVHAGTSYRDCTRPFIDACQGLVDVYADGAVQIAAPFLDWYKGDIFRFATESHVPFELTYSCEVGGVTPCGACTSCLDRARLQ